ncbi:MAG: sulfatase-like hydrolase/transferase [Actinomycetota bacterium]
MLLPPVGAVLITEAVGLARTGARRIAHRTFIGLGFGLIVLQLASRVGASTAPAVALGAVLGGGAAVAYHRGRWVRQLVSMALPAPFVFAAFFLLTPPVSRLLIPSAVVPGTSAGLAARAPVIIVIFDEFPSTSLLDAEGRINRNRFPNFAAFADRAFWFPNAVTVADQTQVAVPATLTGTVPEQGSLPTLGDHPRNMFTFLSGQYTIHAVEPFTLLAPEAQQELVAPPFPSRVLALLDTAKAIYARIVVPRLYAHEAGKDVFGEFVNAPFAAAGGNEVTAEEKEEQQRAAIIEVMGTDQVELFRRFTQSIGAEQRHLYFLHLFLPHKPYKYLPSGQSYEDPGVPGRRGTKWADSWFTLQAYQRHLLQLRRLDALVGEFVQQLEEVGAFDDAIVVLMADHGASFRAGEEHRRARAANVEDIGLVPLLIKAPHLEEGRVIESTVRLIDVFPAIADLLGVEIPWEIEGISPFGRPRKEAHVIVRNEFGRLYRLSSPQRARLEGGRRLAELFGSGEGPFDLFAFGPHADLVGRPEAEVGSGETSAVRGRLENSAAFDAVDLSSGIVPAYLRADLSGLRAENTHMGVALNGTMATVVPVNERSGSAGKLAALLPGHLFRDGENRVTLYAVSGSGPTRTVRLVRAS